MRKLDFATYKDKVMAAGPAKISAVCWGRRLRERDR